MSVGGGGQKRVAREHTLFTGLFEPKEQEPASFFWMTSYFIRGFGEVDRTVGRLGERAGE